MSSRPPASRRPKVTLRTLQRKKTQGEPITMLTAYDYPTARIVDEAGIDVILVGDSVGMVVLGYETTLPVTMEEMLHHTKAVARARPSAMVVADMPLGSFQVDDAEAVRNALRFIKEAGADAVKIEGGQERTTTVRRMVQAQVPVMGHIGLTPQSYLLIGGFVRPGKSKDEWERLLEDALALEAAGCFSIVLECVPAEWARDITQRLQIPTIGIGSGPDCDGQVLVFHDLVGLTPFPPPFAPRLLNAYELFRQTVEEFRTRVEQRNLCPAPTTGG
ncbi:MAG: 3-methyl-2-oxobutanoate hydroxymethyltransferase [Acidobacteria bacterium]|nr:3-methyl-2-oxobutanoate hydroxymethyltransferase [Acidobacteriota bacterium]MDW7984691.1 3-methyl-2-oxobutanoate hydroxymethyltransferase [Acidobacteriota bacterium]